MSEAHQLIDSKGEGGVGHREHAAHSHGEGAPSDTRSQRKQQLPEHLHQQRSRDSQDREPAGEGARPQPPLQRLQRRPSLPPPDRFDLPQELREHKICAHGLAEEMAGLVREMIDVEDLAKVHTTEHGRRAVAGEAGRKNGFEKRWTTAINQPKYRERLDACIRGFVRDFVPAAIDAERHGYTEICYQAMPSLRIHMPHAAETQAHIALHKDYDYFHQPNEINFWIPLVAGVGGSNSLLCESAHGAEDYTPFEVGFGECMRFWGNQCRHYTVENKTETSRVSFDLRVVPKALFDNAWPSPQGNVCFRLGEFYASVPVP